MRMFLTVIKIYDLPNVFKTFMVSIDVARDFTKISYFIERIVAMSLLILFHN